MLSSVVEFVALVLDLVDKDALGPAELFRHADVELSFQGVLAFAENNQVLSPIM
jgi:hypothetical protein